MCNIANIVNHFLIIFTIMYIYDIISLKNRRQDLTMANAHFPNRGRDNDEIFQKRYSANQDFSGKRIVVNNQEMVDYRLKSMHRIWYNEQANGYATHWHSAMEITVPIENYYEARVGDTLYHLEPDEILIIPPREVHEILPPPEGSRFIYIMNVDSIVNLRSFSGIAPILSQPVHMTPTTHPRVYDDIYNILVSIRSEYFNQNEFSELSIQALLLNLFVKLGENRSQEKDLFNNVNPGKQHEYIQRFNVALEYIDTNYTEDISLEDLADKIGFSKFHFSRLFKQYTDYNFSDYLCLRRVKAAEELLEDPSYSITEVALNSGFSSISTFNRIFKQKKGITPSEYRKIYTRRETNYIVKQP